MGALKDMMGSKKGLSFFIAVGIAAFGHKLNIPDDRIDLIIYLTMAYQVGQGVADIGKGKASLESLLKSEVKS